MINSIRYIFGKVNGVDLDVDAEAFLNAAAISDITIVNAINNLVIDLKSNSLWTKFYFIYPMVGGNSTSHSYNLKNTSLYQLTFFGGWMHTSTGALPNGTNGYANTSFIPRGTVGQNSFGISYYSRTNNISNNGLCIMGCADNTSPLSACTMSSIGATSTYFTLNDYTFLSIPTTGSLGLISNNRISSIVSNYWRKNVKTNVNVTSTNTPNLNIVLAANKTNSNIQQHSSYECAFSSSQEGFSDSEMIIYNNIVQTFQTALGRQV